MRVAFVSENLPNDIRAFSGTPYFMSRAIRSQVESFDYVHVPMFNWETVFSNPEKALTALMKTGQLVSKRLKTLAIDIVICQGTSMIPFLDTEKPIALWHDSTWDCLLQLDFEEFKSCHPLLRDWDQIVFDKCSLVVFAAEWLRDASLLHYKIQPEKIMVIPFGANLEPRDLHEIDSDIRARQGKPCQLTFLGIDWVRKGASAAYSLLDRLNREGCPATLTVIGSDQLKGGQSDTANLLGLRLRGDRRVAVEGFLDKERRADRERLSKILTETHFLVHPAGFECFGIALVEANAYGVPVLAIDRFGPQTIIRNEVNGCLFDPGDFVAQASQFIKGCYSPFDKYQKLARATFDEYQSRLNWDTSVKHFLDALKHPLTTSPRPGAGAAPAVKLGCSL